MGARKNAIILKIKISQLAPFLKGVELGGVRLIHDKKDGTGQNYLAVDINSQLELPPPLSPHAEHAWHLYILRIRLEQLNINRNQFIEKLKSLGIGTSVHFVPLHMHPYYQRTFGYRRGDFPAAEDAFNRCMSLPIFPGMTGREIGRVIAAVIEIVGESRKRVAVAA